MSEPPPSLGAKARKAVGWSAISQIIVFGTSFSLNIVLARLLAPEEFGLVAMVIVFTGFAALFADLGLGVALVQLKNLEERHRSTIFWLQLLSGIFLTGLTCAVAPLLAAFFGDERVKDLAFGMSPLFLLISLGSVHLKLQHRRVQFKKVSIIEMASALTAGIAATVLALNGAGVWALVARPLMLAGVRTSALWATSPWRPRLLFDRQAAKEVAGVGSGFTLTVVINYWTKRAGDLIVGHSLGTTQLGYYNRAFALMLQPVTQVTMVIMRVMYPVMARLQDDAERVRETYARTVVFVALVTFPITLGLVALAEPFVLGLLGENWAPMVLTLQLFGLAGMINSVDNTGMHLFIIRGHTGALVRWRTFTAVVTLTAFFLGSFWGVNGVASAFLLRSIALAPFNFWVPGRPYEIGPVLVVRRLYKVFLSAALMCVAVGGAAHLLQGTLSHRTQLGLLVPAGALIYIACLQLLRVPEFGEALNLVRRKLGSRSS